MLNDAKKEFTITRVFDAPRELVWKAWTDPKLLAQWWGPQGVTNPICEFDAVPNGAIHIVMEAGEEMGDFKGTRWPMTGTIKEIEEPSRLVYSSINMTDAAGSPTFETLITVTFENDGEKTKMTFHVEVTLLADTPETQFAFGGMRAGWNQAIEKLNDFLNKQ